MLVSAPHEIKKIVDTNNNAKSNSMQINGWEVLHHGHGHLFSGIFIVIFYPFFYLKMYSLNLN